MKNFTSFEKCMIENGGHAAQSASYCTDDEILRMKHRGALVFLPVIIACFSMFITVLYLTASVYKACIGGVVWAFCIFLIDRALMSGTASLLSFSAIGRILFSVISSLVVAECLVLVVFSDSIRESQQSVMQEKTNNIVRKYDAKKDLAFNVYESSRKELESKTKIFTDEIDGKGGSRKRGWGEIGDVKHDNLLMARKKFTADSLKYYKNIEQLDSIQSIEISELKNNKAENISGQLKTLASIDDDYIKIAVWLFRFLILLAEMMPIFLKYTKPKPSDIYQKVLSLQSQQLLEELNLYTKLQMDILNEKSKNTKSKAKIQAGYDNNIDEMSMYEAYVNEMDKRYETMAYKHHLTENENVVSSASINADIFTKLDAKWQDLMGVRT